jgi:hypothetical protein
VPMIVGGHRPPPPLSRRCVGAYDRGLPVSKSRLLDELDDEHRQLTVPLGLEHIHDPQRTAGALRDHVARL